MSLRNRIALALLGLLGGYLLLTTYVLRSVVVPTFNALETADADHDVQRVERALASLAARVNGQVADNAYWDDTYEFLTHGGEEYPETNLESWAYEETDLSLLMLFDARGAPVWTSFYDLENREFLDLAQALPRALEPEDPLVRHTSLESARIGLLRTSRGAMVAASRAVLTNERGGPIAGTMVFGRLLDAAKLAALRNEIEVDFDLVSLDQEELAVGPSPDLAALASSEQEALRMHSDQVVTSYRLLRDVYGEPAYAFVVRTPRGVTRAGDHAVGVALAFLALAGLVFTVGMWILLRRLIALAQARDAAEETSRLKSEFLATVSHEIRTPMNGVMGMAELLLRTQLTERQRRFGERIRQSAQSLLGIINDILDFSRLDAGRLRLEIREFDLRGLVEEIGLLFASTAHAKGLELVCSAAPSLPDRWRGDPDRLRQILVNLVGNAIKFTERGEVALRAGLAELSDAEGRVGFEVVDTGIGIRGDQRPNVFESFSQADASTTREYGGSGLGLAICKQLVALMGGEIGFDSEPGRGTSFWLSIPLARAEAASGSGSQDPPAALRNARVLVVDDSSSQRAALVQTLESWHARCEEAESGPEALAALRSAGADADLFAVALVDLDMPNMNGLRLARAIQSDPELENVPLVLLTSSVAPDDEAAWRHVGIRAQLVKPPRSGELRECLVAALGGASVASQRFQQPPSPGQRLTGRVLLVEDNPVNQEVALAMLQDLGCRTELARHGGEAVELLARSRFDLVLMDCQMPVVDGYQATAQIRLLERNRAGAPRVPIVALTANAIEGDREKCLAADMDDYLSKPFTTSQLRQVLERWLARRDADPMGPAPPQAADSAGRGELPAESGAGADAEAAPAVDPEAVEALRRLDVPGRPSVLAKVVGAYYQSSRELLEDLEAAVADGSGDAVRAAAHTLKSSSATVGAHVLAAVCRELEAMGRGGDLDGAKASLARAVEEHQRATRELAERTGIDPN